MKNVIRKPGSYKAEQFIAHDKPFDFGDIEVTQKEGISGYGAKLGYFADELGRMKTIRPHEWLVQDEHGKLFVVNPDDFKRDYMLANGENSGQNRRGRPPKVA